MICQADYNEALQNMAQKWAKPPTNAPWPFVPGTYLGFLEQQGHTVPVTPDAVQQRARGRPAASAAVADDDQARAGESEPAGRQAPLLEVAARMNARRVAQK